MLQIVIRCILLLPHVEDPCMSSSRAAEQRIAADDASASDQRARPTLETRPIPQSAENDEPAVPIRPSSNPPDPLVGNESPTTLWLRRADQLLLGGLLIALLILLIIARWKLSGGGRTEIEIISQQPRTYFYAIEINRASWVEWAQLDGIGEKLARRIVQDREEHGPFKSITDIGRVKGLGPKLIEKLRPFLRCLDEDSKSSGQAP